MVVVTATGAMNDINRRLREYSGGYHYNSRVSRVSMGEYKGENHLGDGSSDWNNNPFAQHIVLIGVDTSNMTVGTYVEYNT